MQKLKLALIEDVMLANNGYMQRDRLIVNARNAVPGSTLSAAGEALDELVKWGQLSLLGQNAEGKKFYCLPENWTKIRQMMKEITGG